MSCWREITVKVSVPLQGHLVRKIQVESITRGPDNLKLNLRASPTLLCYDDVTLTNSNFCYLEQFCVPTTI